MAAAAAAGRRRTYVNSSVCSSFTSRSTSWLLFFFWIVAESFYWDRRSMWDIHLNGNWPTKDGGSVRAREGLLLLVVVSADKSTCLSCPHICVPWQTSNVALLQHLKANSFAFVNCTISSDDFFCRHEATPSELRRRKADRPDVTAGGGLASKEA